MARSMKYRLSKIKQEHSMIKGLKKLLQKLAKMDEIKSIVPGRISPSKNVQALHLTFQYEIEGGIRCLAKGEGVQEIFIICDDLEKVKERILTL